jgi:sporulation protein YlmC with PRC-barrel domain
MCFMAIMASAGVSAQEVQWKIDTDRLGLMEPASVLIGQRVLDRDRKTLGNIRDLVLDFEGGRVLATLLPASKGQLTPLPARSYAFVSSQTLIAETDRNRFDSAPKFPKGTTAANLDPKSLAPSFHYFGQTPAEPVKGSLGPLSSGADLVGTTLLSQDNQPLGKLQEIMVDLLMGRIVYLVIEPITATRPAPRLIPLPPLAVQLDPQRKSLMLKTSREHFLAGPNFPKEFRTDLIFPQLATAVCKHYDLESALPASAKSPQPAAAEAQKAAGARSSR